MPGSNALADLQAGLGAVDDVLSFAKEGVGKPKKREQSLFVASVALSYAVWENFVEEVAIEVTTILAGAIPEGSVPPSVREWIMKVKPIPDAWDLVVHPGWRELWVRMVRARAKGDSEDDGDFGILTANLRNVERLFERVGVRRFEGVPKAEQDKLEQLVAQHGLIVHTGKAPDDFRKKTATDWRAFVESLGQKVDSSIATQAKALIGSSPW